MAKKRSSKAKYKKKSLVQKWFLSKGSITFKVLLAVIIIGSVALVSGVFPKSQITPQDPDAPILRPVVDEDTINQDSLQLRSIGFEKCSETAAVVMLLDTTGSMTGSKIRKLKESTKLFAQNFTDDSVIGVQRFSSQNISEVVPVSLYGEVKSTLASKIDALPSAGQTPTTDGLRFSLGILQQALPQYPDRNFAFIFISDGAPVPATQDPRLPQNAPDPSSEIKNLGVTIYSIGILNAGQIRSGSMKQLLEHIASSPDKAYIAPDGDQLSEIYSQIGTDLCQSAG